ncbi:GDSL-type esterase/lipase family protein [Amycolatopsis sp. NPDC049868]|uniref:GDSL-type esterase/lipase family protein n=1 Tax=Amycolatopsis sp. NPDC049868 TaxID=3363934 RepID=UPI0037A91B7D
MKVIKRVAVVVATACVFASVIGASAPASANEPPPRTFKHYVALGDSSVAAPVVGGWDPGLCLRGIKRYPTELQKRLKAEGVNLMNDTTTLTEVECTGALTLNLSRYAGIVALPSSLRELESVPVGVAQGLEQGKIMQADSVKSDTDLVTISIGANDLWKYVDLTKPCDPFQAFIAALLAPALEKRLVATIEDVAGRASPNAVIAVTGYVSLKRAEVPGGCWLFPWQPTVGDTLNRAIKDAVGNASAHEGSSNKSQRKIRFVDIAAAAENHVGPPVYQGAFSLNPTDGIANHPTAEGVDMYADAIADVLKAAG